MNKISKLLVAAVVTMVTCATFAGLRLSLTGSAGRDDSVSDYSDSSDSDVTYYLGGDEEYLTFSLDSTDFPADINGNEVLTEYLPDGVEVEWTGKKLKTPKSSAPKVKKVDGVYEVVVSEKGEDNPSGLKLSYKKKKGTVSGSFKVYAISEGKNGRLKLKSYSAKVSGVFGSEDGLTVKISKVGTFSATLE